jgi:hypothetical protein
LSHLTFRYMIANIKLFCSQLGIIESLVYLRAFGIPDPIVILAELQEDRRVMFEDIKYLGVIVWRESVNYGPYPNFELRTYDEVCEEHAIVI